MLCLKVIARYLGLWLRAQTRSSSCLAAGYNRDGVVKFVGGTVLAVAVFRSNCEVLGLWLRAQTRSSSCLAAGYNRDGVVRFVGGTVLAVAVFRSNCEGTWALAAGSNSVVKLLGGPGTIGMVSSGLLAALCKQLLCLKGIARYLGLWLRVQTRSSSCLAENGTSSRPAVDGVTWCTFGTVLCDEELQRRTVGEIVFQRLDPFKIKGKVNSV